MSQEAATPAAPTVDVLQPKLERRMSINPSFEYDDMKPRAGFARYAEELRAAWQQLPLPVRVLAGTAVLAITAPALRRAAGTLGIEPAELLQIIQQD
jgi:hypothetical protein